MFSCEQPGWAEKGCSVLQSLVEAAALGGSVVEAPPPGPELTLALR